MNTVKKWYRQVSAIAISVLALNAQAEPIWHNKANAGDDYLVGTIHLGDQRLNQLPQAIKTAIDNVDVVVLELDLNSLTPLEQQQLTVKYGLLPAGDSLAKQLSAPVYQQAQDYLAKLGADIQQFDRLKPWMLGLTMMQMSYANMGLNPNNGVDKQIHQYALSKGKRIIGLETFEQQLQFFEQIVAANPNVSADDMILDTLNELKKYQGLPKQMLDAWFKGDMATLETIYQQTLKQSEFDKFAEQILLSNRNKAWQQQLQPMLEQQKVLVAVGTLHFAGPDSLLRLLGKGFTKVD